MTVEAKDVFTQGGEPMLLELKELGVDKHGGPRNLYALTVDMPTEYREQIIESLIANAKQVGAALGFDADDEDDMERLETMARDEAESMLPSFMGVAEPFNICFN